MGEGIAKYVAGLLDLPQKSELLKFIGVAMGGILVALQALASHRRAKAMEESAAAQARATLEQANANLNTEQGQRQERLKNAIEHLGHGSVSVRLVAPTNSSIWRKTRRNCVRRCWIFSALISAARRPKGRIGNAMPQSPRRKSGAC